MRESDGGWRPCSACEKPIGFGDTYWMCSVSTCQRKRTALHFCSVSCWEVHLPVARHREAWAEEHTAPNVAETAAVSSAESEPPRKHRRLAREVRSRPESTPRAGGDKVPREVLIIASRLKEYVRATSGFNTSDRALEPLSEIVREACDRAVRRAAGGEASRPAFERASSAWDSCRWYPGTGGR